MSSLVNKKSFFLFQLGLSVGDLVQVMTLEGSYVQFIGLCTQIKAFPYGCEFYDLNSNIIRYVSRERYGRLISRYIGTYE